jgi:hypothetical protein
MDINKTFMMMLEEHGAGSRIPSPVDVKARRAPDSHGEPGVTHSMVMLTVMALLLMPSP